MRIAIEFTVLATLLSLPRAVVSAQGMQVADTTYDAEVRRPAFTRSAGPRVGIDAAHHNVHTADGRYRPFAELLRNDGFRVSGVRTAAGPAALRAIDVLVIANALGGSDAAHAAADAFTAAEARAIRTWVLAGGKLLLIADHEPAGSAVRSLAAGLGVAMSTGRTLDDPHSDWTSGSPSWLVFSTDTGARLGNHPIIRGRDTLERIHRIVTFTGQSLRGPANSVALLSLANGAVDVMPDGSEVSADGRSQAVALELGRGRVVVVGEAALFTAQVTTTPDGTTRRFGFTWPDNDDKQFVLNVLHWLSGVLK